MLIAFHYPHEDISVLRSFAKNICVALVISFGASAASAEVLTASFTTPDGGVTTGLYDGLVQVTVSGSGMSDGQLINDAFYVISNGTPTHDGDYYQLTVSTTALVPFAPSQDAANFLVGTLPAFRADGTYSLVLNTGATVPTQLHFGVSDGDFADNSGAYTITVAEVVPEPASLALLGTAAALVAFHRRRVWPSPASGRGLAVWR